MLCGSQGEGLVEVVFSALVGLGRVFRYFL